MTPRILLPLLGMLILCARSLPAQTDTPASEQTPKTVHVTFTSLGWDNALPKVFYKSGQKPVTFAVPSFTRSQQQTYTGDPHLTFYVPVEVPGKPTENRPIGEVTLPPESDKLLLIFIPVDSEHWRIVVMPENTEAFPPGKARIVNTTPDKLAVKPRGSPLMTLEPGKQALLDGNGINLGLEIAFLKNDKWQIATSGIFGLKPDKRCTIFIVAGNSNYFKLQKNDGSVIDSGPIQLFSLTD
jgi:hypothetical protein